VVLAAPVAVVAVDAAKVVADAAKVVADAARVVADAAALDAVVLDAGRVAVTMPTRPSKKTSSAFTAVLRS
jgi:hypothetical protein